MAERTRLKKILLADPCECEGEPVGSIYYCDRCRYITSLESGK